MIYHTIVWWHPLVLVLPVFFLTVVGHELAHGLTARWFGASFSIYPYPHMFKDTFYWGRCCYTYTDRSLNNRNHKLIVMAPRITNAAFLFFFLCLYALTTEPAWKTVWTLFAGSQVVDGIIGVVGIFWYKERPGKDIWIYYRLVKEGNGSQDYGNLLLTSLRIESFVWIVFLLFGFLQPIRNFLQ